MTIDRKSAFTLIELLVVITIMVVLLSILTPALDRAIYQATLVRCGANMRAGVQGGLQYAFDNKRYYTVHGSGGWMPNFVRFQGDYDLIALLRPYTGIAVFYDPFVGQLDLEPSHNDDITQLVAENCWYFGWGGRNWRMTRKMNKVGDRMEFQMSSDTQSHSSTVVVSDFDMWSIESRQAYASHKDDAGGLNFERYCQNANNPYLFNLPVQKVTMHWWEVTGAPADPMRGPIDSNYGFDDGSIRQYIGVRINDERMCRVQDAPDGNPYTRGQHLPRN